MRLFILPLGSCGNDKEKIFTPQKDVGVWIEVPIWAALIQVKGLNILVDTGMHPVHIQDSTATFGGTPYVEWIRPKMQAEDLLDRRLGEIGLSPEDIDIVINTHLHFDHAGGNYLFPQATFLVQQEHYQHALGMPEAFPPRYYLLPGLNYELLRGEITLVPGVELILSPGHVPGMQTVVLDLPDTGTVILASDAISLEEHLLEDRWEGYWNPKSARASARRMSSIAQARGGRIFFGHDPAWWESVTKSPDHYS
jgi:N-acyl homoserine lactone hydrolase